MYRAPVLIAIEMQQKVFSEMEKPGKRLGKTAKPSHDSDYMVERVVICITTAGDRIAKDPVFVTTLDVFISKLGDCITVCWDKRYVNPRNY